MVEAKGRNLKKREGQDKWKGADAKQVTISVTLYIGRYKEGTIG